MSSGDDESPSMGHDFRAVWRDLANSGDGNILVPSYRFCEFLEIAILLEESLREGELLCTGLCSKHVHKYCKYREARRLLEVE